MQERLYRLSLIALGMGLMYVALMVLRALRVPV
jgi:hypothetical protein